MSAQEDAVDYHFEELYRSCWRSNTSRVANVFAKILGADFVDNLGVRDFFAEVIGCVATFDDKENVGAVNMFDFSVSAQPNALAQASHFIGVGLVTFFVKFGMIAQFVVLDLLARVFIKD